MQRPYAPSPPNQAQRANLFTSSPVSSGSATSTTTAHRGPLEPSATFTPNRVSNGLKISSLLYNSSPNGPKSSMSAVYQQPYDHGPSAPGDRPVMLMGMHHQNDAISDTSSTATGPMVSTTPQQQPHKRAYRQRRKDPSCDACRERKVKCDASDASSCTECSNRNVRCLFTKETNRRMSSIKQVQDLERQLAQAKLQLQQLRSGIPKINSLMDPDYEVNEDTPKIPEIGCRPNRLNTPNVNYNYSHVSSKMGAYGQGLIDRPPTPSFVRPQPLLLATDLPPLPPTSVTDALIRQYFSCVHCIFPILHWPTFLEEYDRIQRTGTLRGASRGWAAVFFSIIGCGSLHSLDSDLIAKGKGYIEISVKLIDLWQDGFSIDQVRASMLISLFLYEFNLKSASWVWLGSAIRVAQDLRLHIEPGQWPPIDAEIRKRLWWSLYAWERIVVLELGRPLMINDEDCDVDLPSPIEEHLIPDGGPIAGDQKATALLVTSHILRCVSQLKKALKGLVVSSDTLELFDRHFRMCLATFPPDYRMQSNQYLDPRSLSPVIFLQNTRLVLHRHNLSPSSSPEMRHNALDQCLAVAHDTTRILSRCMRTPTSLDSENSNNTHSGDWRYTLATAANTVLCTHLWRCILILLFRADYPGALICIQASSAIGEARSANISSGRYISFFLKALLDKKQRGNLTNPERDEELMAYVSGDLQSSMDNSWIWKNSDIDPPLNVISPRSSPSLNMSPLKTRFIDGSNQDETIQDWEGWDWIEKMTQLLSSEQQKQQQKSAVNMAETPRSIAIDAQPAIPFNRPPETTDSSQTNNASSKMTIASII